MSDALMEDASPEAVRAAIGIFGIGMTDDAAIQDVSVRSGWREPTVRQDESLHWVVSTDTGEDAEFIDESDARAYAHQKGFIALACTRRLYEHVRDIGAPSRWTTDAAGLQDLDEAEVDIEVPAIAGKYIDPNHTDVAAILAFDIDSYGHKHDAIAAALAPHVAGAPALREWDCDDEFNAAEEAVNIARLFVEKVANQEAEDKAGNDGWWKRQDYLDRLRQMQSGHRKSLVHDRLGEFPGYTVRIDEWFPDHPVIRIYPSTGCTDLATSMFTLDKDATRREVELSIAAWQAGHEQGTREGADRIRRGIKDLLEVDAAFTACA